MKTSFGAFCASIPTSRTRPLRGTTHRSRYEMVLKLGAKLLFVAVMVSALFGATPALQAQGLNSAFGGGFAASSNEPINIESDSLEVNDAKKTAIFRGNVIAVQGDMEMRTPELEVSYSGQVSGDKKSAGPGGQGTQLTRLRAKKKVLITSQKNQTAKSDWADFDVKKQLITIGGNVVVSQGGNIMKGEKLIIDLKKGTSRFETASNSGSGGRVRGVFHPQKKSARGAKPTLKKKKLRPTIVDGWSAAN